jgi:hypothetical protein
MPAFLQASAEAHINTVKANAPQYFKDFSDLTQRGHALLNLMKHYGMVEYNAGAASNIWQIAVREPQVKIAADTTRKTFANSDVYEQCQVDVRGYETDDLLTELQYKTNQDVGGTQLINLYDQKMRNLGITMLRRVQEYIYRDGDSAAFSNGFQGFDSCLGEGTVVAGDKVAAPADNYAGHSCALGGFGGSWSSDLASGDRLNASIANDWPYGQGTSDYDAWSPVLWNWSSTAWGSGTTKWEDNVEEVVREAEAVMRSRNGFMNNGDIPICLLLAPNLFSGAKNYYSTRMRIYQPFSGGDVGFPADNIQIDGVVLKSDYGIKANEGYAISPQHCELFTLPTMNGGGEDQMYDVFGPTWTEQYAAYLMRVSIFGNLKLSPKFMMKFKNYA